MIMIHRHLFILLVSIVVTVALPSCNRLSKQARQIAGNYIIPELSQTEPVMELNRNATCVIRAIKPGVLTYSVNGRWNVERDSLVMNLDPSSITFEGDSSLIGTIPVRSARKVVEYNEFYLQLENDGIIYYYKKI